MRKLFLCFVSLFIVIFSAVSDEKKVEQSSDEKRTFARFIPERSDDFAWENDLIAFRVYGPALEKGAENSGIDCWLKRVKYPIINKWYKKTTTGKGSYHKDTGEGCDPYHVGSTLGCGGSAVWEDGRMYKSNVFRKWKILEKSPGKTIFELYYGPWSVNGREITEIKRITIELGKRLFRVDSSYSIDGKPGKVSVAVGLTTHNMKAEVYSDPKAGILACWEKMPKKNGGLGTGVIVEKPSSILKYKKIDSKKKDDSHIIFIAETDKNGKIAYFAGYGWDKAGDITSFDIWKKYLGEFIAKDKRVADTMTPNLPKGLSLDKNMVKKEMMQVFDWQIRNLRSAKLKLKSATGLRGWVHGAFLTGVMEAWRATGNMRYLEYAEKASKKCEWKLGPRLRHADDHIVGQTYCELYKIKPEADKIQPLRESFDKIMKLSPSGKEEWSWCDALYMAPPTFARLADVTGEEKYLDFMNKMYWESADFLFDRKEKLFYRDKRFMPEFTKLNKEETRRKKKIRFIEPNGQKMFWSRGNGWVFAGLARLIPYIPPDYPDREKYIDLFKEMASRLIELQNKDGLWRPSLLCPEQFKHGEVSGSGFFCYGLLWGINNGILEKEKYLSGALKCWEAMVKCIHKDGKLGYVQPIGASPDKFNANTSQEYGSGAFLAAGGELYKLLGGHPTTFKQDRDTTFTGKKSLKEGGIAGEAFPTLTENGAYCWFQDPRAVYIKGTGEKLYSSWVSNKGELYVGSYNYNTQKVKQCVIRKKWDIDDHNSGSFIILPDKRLLFIYARHSKDGIYCRTSLKPEDITEWGDERTIWKRGDKKGATYNHGFYLTSEKKFYVFWRGGTWKPEFAISADGKGWSKSKVFIQSPAKSGLNVRPYCKYHSNGKDTIHMVFTDGHPRNESKNSVYYLKYRNGAFYKADGTKIKDMSELPIAPEEADVVYDAKKSGVRAWIWDIALNQKGNPVILFTKLPQENNHRYWYAVWSGEIWVQNEITPGGKWFPQTKTGKTEKEHHYSGGMCLNQNDPSIVYLSREVKLGKFEIEKWITNDSGKSWKSEAITSNSKYINIRPVYPKGASGDKIIWMNGEYIHYTKFNTSIRIKASQSDMIYSDLWGKSGEKWSPESRLPDFSYAGYCSGERQIPKLAVKTDVRKFGAVGDGVADDTDAFIKAIEATNDGAVFIPEGRYKITRIIEIKKSNIVLRGAGKNKTILCFPVPLNNIKPNWGHTTGGRKTSNYSWSGGLIWFKGQYLGKKLAKIAEKAKRGAQELVVDGAVGIKVGHKIVIYLTDDKKQTLFRYLYSGNPGDFSKFLKTYKIPFSVTVRKKDGNRIFFDRPLRTDIRPEWNPEIRAFTPSLENSGIENLRIEFPANPYEGHFTELGYNAVAMSGVVNCWVRNIVITNADSGIFTSGAFCTLENILIESNRKEKKGFTGHHGIELRGVDNLCENIQFTTCFHHDLGLSKNSIGNVYSNGKGVNFTFDHHKRAPYENLYTEIDVGEGTKVWKCGGGKNLGKNCASRGTFWNIKSAKPLHFPSATFAPDTINFVGLITKDKEIKDRDGKWFEVISPDKIFPLNLYKAQLKRRLNNINHENKNNKDKR